MRHSKAFTLAEVVVAMALFAFAVVVLSQSIHGSLTSLQKLEKRYDGKHEMRRLRHHIFDLPDRAAVEAGGEIDYHGQKIVWQAEIEPTALLDYYRLEVEVEFQGGETARPSRETVLYALRPRWSEEEERGEILQAKTEWFDAIREEREGL